MTKSPIELYTLVGGALLFTVTTIVVIALLVKRIRPFTAKFASKIKIIAKQELSYKNQLLILEVNNMNYLIGLNHHTIKVLDKFKLKLDKNSVLFSNQEAKNVNDENDVDIDVDVDE